MNKKITSSALAALMIAGSTSFTAFAAMADGTVVIGNKAFSLEYANNPANAAEITNAIVAGGAVYVKDFAGNWIDNVTTKAVDASLIPAVVYKSADKEINYAAADKEQATNVTSMTASATGDNKIVVKFNSPIGDVDHTNFSISGDLAVIDATVSSDKMSVELTTNLSFVDGVTYSVVASDMQSAAGVKTEDLKATFKYDIKGFQKPTLSKTALEAGQNIKDFVVVKDEDGKVISADKYEVTGLECDVTGAIDTETGLVLANESTSALVRLTVEMYTGDVIESDKLTVDISVPTTSATAVNATFDTPAFDNAVAAQRSTSNTELEVGTTGELFVYTKDGKGNPEDNYLMVNTEEYNVAVNKDSLNFVKNVMITDNNTISVDGKAVGTAHLTVTRKADGVKYPVTFTVVQPNTDYKDLSLTATAATLVKGNGANGADTEENVDMKTIDIAWLDQDDNDTAIDFSGADETLVSNAKASLTVVDQAETGDKVVISTQSDAITLTGTATGIEIATKDSVVPQNALVTVTYYKAGAKTSTTRKNININIVKEGAHSKYIIEQDGTLDAKKASTQTVSFNTYSVDANGVKRDDVTADTVFDFKTGLAKNVDHWMGDFTENVVGFDLTEVPNVNKLLNYAGEFTITYQVNNAQALGEQVVKFTNTAVVQKSAAVNTKPVAIKLDATDAADGININEIIFGKANVNELKLDADTNQAFAVTIGQDGYKYNAPLVSVKNTANAVMTSGAAVYGIGSDTLQTNLVELGFSTDLSKTNALTADWDIVNATNLENADGVLTIAAGKTSATFTIAIDAIYVDGDTRTESDVKAVKKEANLLSAPVYITVTLTR